MRRQQIIAKQRNVFISILIAALIFFAFQMGLFYRDCLSQEEKTFELESQLRLNDRIIAEQKQQLIMKSREIFRLERSLRRKETSLLRQSQSASNVTIYVITATYARPTQKADLTRFSYTLALVPNVFWIIVEDSPNGLSSLVQGVAKRSKVRHLLLNVPTPEEKRVKTGQPSWTWPRGVAQRNEALKWMRTNLHPDSLGVVYIADDDNTYDIRLFDEMRKIRKVGVWPVAFVGQVMLERPKVEGDRVVDWLVQWGKKRPYAIDMAGFAVNLMLVLKRTNAVFTFNVSRGMQESFFLSRLISGLSDLEPLADSCTKVYVWHTKTRPPSLLSEKLSQKSDGNIEI